MKYLDLLNSLTDCPFCNMESEDVLVDKESAYLTISIAPYHPDHLLVTTKRHIKRILELNDQENSDINSLLHEGMKILKDLGYEDFTMLVREGKKTGKSIEHIHYHLIPETIIGDLNHKGIDRLVLNNQEKVYLLERLKSKIKPN